jgi:hypothetical protein
MPLRADTVGASLVPKSGKSTVSLPRATPPPLNILSKIPTLPQSKWVLQGERHWFIIVSGGCCGKVVERWGEQNQMDERSPCRMGCVFFEFKRFADNEE